MKLIETRKTLKKKKRGPVNEETGFFYFLQLFYNFHKTWKKSIFYYYSVTVSMCILLQTSDVHLSFFFFLIVSDSGYALCERGKKDCDNAITAIFFLYMCVLASTSTPVLRFVLSYLFFFSLPLSVPHFIVAAVHMYIFAFTTHVMVSCSSLIQYRFTTPLIPLSRITRCKAIF